MSTLYASFVDAAAAERATGALLDQGATAADISVVANEAYNSVRAVNANAKALDAEQGGKSGISTTTAGDAAVGAVKGATIGVGVGIAAALAALFIPGIGIVIGGGALATAIAGGAATALAGSAAGGVVGYLRDQGVPDEVITHYNDHFVQGGAILAIAIPSGTLSSGEIEGMLVKYGASNLATYNSTQVLVDNPAVQLPRVPLAVDNANIDPLSITPATVAIVESVPTATTTVIDASTGESRVVRTEVEPTLIDPITGLPVSAVIVDPLTHFEQVAVVEDGIAVETPVLVTKRSDVDLL